MITNSLNSQRKPVVLMSMGAQLRAGHDYQVMTNKYMRPLLEHAQCLPILAPTCFGIEDIDHYLSMVDGIYLTGAGSNIDPTHYQEENKTPEKSQDRQRDKFDLALIKAALKLELPFFGICRGMQELNVALGGSLHQQLYLQSDALEHREDTSAPIEQQYGPSHDIHLREETWFTKLMQVDQFKVNSLHGQGIKQLGQGVEVLATAPDGAIEAIHLPEYSQFSLAVQWHPEWQAASNPYSIRMFKAFGDACRLQMRMRHEGSNALR